ncbi:MAG: methyltransferase domain-containing protein [Meiothermus sp.]|uniref:tRNA (guanine(46)-N(7))-methyltransferase TrmB n=1 Tax=Meiothermus sp. TaxID=1955249 RepID=UPI0025E6CE85|nr:methyltransferase domain-containing protein [Meiothermus sp.]MCS7057280.1 methyltransferase domain-containing protein [Meiothermus sp.]MCS7193649.1 methyltransferase domain-containing protein [Meiothermus sp.]MCX7740655.1 methyltransferase domain-containing protein [Meiothermus sp.]MDW8091448.1 methyltransferase domain-containing protein [Meiothermus sp.]MDW8481916.1 methyltransferase domain-containing protein [Meiothermus sp.]
MLIRLGDVEFPLQPAPEVLEVGFGDGRFTAELARLHPTWRILGVEVSAASVARALRRFRREGIANVWVYHGQAAFALRNLVAPRSLGRVYVNFPDPWPKTKHEGNRLLRRGFFRRLSTRLAEGGELWLITDHEGYWRYAQAEAAASGLFEVDTPPPPPCLLTTKYALKWKEAGRSFYHAVFRKRAEDPAPWPPLPRCPMPHALMSGKLPELGTFEKTVVRFEGGTAVLLEVAAFPGGYYFLTHVEEEDLVQDVLLEARASTHGLYVGLSRFGAPLATPGVRAAVAWLVGFLEGQGLGVLQRSY